MEERRWENWPVCVFGWKKKKRKKKWKNKWGSRGLCRKKKRREELRNWEKVGMLRSWVECGGKNEEEWKMGELAVSPMWWVVLEKKKGRRKMGGKWGQPALGNRGKKTKKRKRACEWAGGHHFWEWGRKYKKKWKKKCWRVEIGGLGRGLMG